MESGDESGDFYDPRQNLYEGTDPMGLRRLIDTSAAQFRLTVNCRNTQAIATHTALLSGREQDETLGHEGPAVELPWGGKTSCGPPILMMQTSWHRLAVDSLARHPLHRLASLRRVERQ